jgi:hypothetical protein
VAELGARRGGLPANTHSAGIGTAFVIHSYSPLPFGTECH